jgi:uncharacterized membrane protein YgcG
MKLFKLVIIIVTLFLIMSTSAFALEAFEINSYDIKMNVKDDNSYEITETINVTFSQQRHGIIRNIPLKTYKGNPVSIKNVKVEGHKFNVSRESGELKIKIGDANRYANKKEQYVISYLFDIGADRITGMDELYFNLIGTDWDTSIDNVTFEITMPFEFDETKLNFTYGEKGSTKNTGVDYSVNGTVIKGRLNYKLAPNEALTVALPLPEGYYVNAKEPVDIVGIIYKYYLLVFSILILAAVILWNIFGRDSRIFPTVEFYAPPGMTPADIGYICDGRVDPYDITSLIIYWADKQYLTITENSEKKGLIKKKYFTLTKLRELEPEAKEYEKEMFYALFNQHGNGISVTTEDLQDSFYLTMGSIRSMVSQLYKGSKDTRIYTVSGSITGFIIKILSFGASFITSLVLFQRITNVFLDKVAIMALIAGAIMLVVVWLLTGLIYNWKWMTSPKKFIAAVIRIIVNVAVFGVTLYFAAMHGLVLFVVTGYITTFVTLLLSAYCMKRTKTGDAYMEKILGFRDFLLHAEKDRINTLVNENPEYFYNVLPFAMVLGVTDKWARKFQDITIEPPRWYRTDRYVGTFSSVMFVQSINESMGHFTSSMTSAPSSSGGSAGGGSSGGGSGGGGGSNW